MEVQTIQEWCVMSLRVKIVVSECFTKIIAELAVLGIGDRKAQGKYICFVDPDDWIEASFLYVINKQIGDCDILVIGFDFDYEDGSTMHVSIGDLEARQVCDKEECMLRLKFNATGHNIFGYIWNKVFKADIIKTNKISFLKDVKFGEDEFLHWLVVFVPIL